MTPEQNTPQADIPALVLELQLREIDNHDSRCYITCCNDKRCSTKLMFDKADAFPAIASHLLAQEQQIAEWRGVLEIYAYELPGGKSDAAFEALVKYPKKP